MASKRANSGPPSEDSDRMTIRPLGAGQEVGRSCHYLEFKDKRILLDCGIHPGKSLFFDKFCIETIIHSIGIREISICPLVRPILEICIRTYGIQRILEERIFVLKKNRF